MNVEKVKKVAKWILWGFGIYALVGAAITIPIVIRESNRDDAKKAAAATAYQAAATGSTKGGDVASLPASPSQTKTDDSAMAPLAIGVAVVYFLPILVAGFRRSNRSAAIFFLNLLLGWTVVGWVVAFIWALGGDSEAQAKSKVIDYDKLAAAMQAKAVPPPPPLV